MSTTQPHLSVQSEGAHLVPKPPEASKRGYVGGAVASALAFALGAFSTYQTIAHGRPIDITRLATSVVLSLGGACNCGLCIKWALATPPLTSRVEPESVMEAGEAQKVDDLIRPLLERINTLITDPKYQQEGSTTEAVSLEDSLRALSQQIDVMTSLLDGLHVRAAATEQELDEKSTQVDEQVEQLKQTFQEQVHRLDTKIAELEARVAPPATPQAGELALLSPAAPAAASPMASGVLSPAQPSPGTASADLVAALTRDIFAGLDSLKFTGSPGSRGSSRPPSAPSSPAVASAPASTSSPSNPSSSRRGKLPASPLGKP